MTADHPTPPPQQQVGRRSGASGSTPASPIGLRRRWVEAFVLGELAGFIPPALTGAVLAAAGVADPVLTAGLMLAGAAEGAVLGAATGRVLRGALPGIQVGAWVRATAGAAAVAWLAGMGGSAAVQALGPVAWIVAGPGMLAGLLAMGFLQWRVLRRVVPRSAVWVPVTSGAWLVGVMIPVAALSLVPDGWPLTVHVGVAIVAGVAMGAAVGFLTGRTLDRLVASVAGRPATVVHRSQGVA